jgi:hypothetical protein
MGTFYYTTVRIQILVVSNFSRSIFQALQTIALFGLKLNRFPAALGALIFFLLYGRHFQMRSTLLLNGLTSAHLSQ